MEAWRGALHEFSAFWLSVTELFDIGRWTIPLDTSFNTFIFLAT